MLRRHTNNHACISKIDCRITSHLTNMLKNKVQSNIRDMHPLGILWNFIGKINATATFN